MGEEHCSGAFCVKDEGKNDLLVNGKNWIQGYCCVLGWAGNLNIHQMIILLGPGGERLGKGRVRWGSKNSWEFLATSRLLWTLK